MLQDMIFGTNAADADLVGSTIIQSVQAASDTIIVYNFFDRWSLFMELAEGALRIVPISYTSRRPL